MKKNHGTISGAFSSAIYSAIIWSCPGAFIRSCACAFIVEATEITCGVITGVSTYEIIFAMSSAKKFQVGALIQTLWELVIVLATKSAHSCFLHGTIDKS